MTIEASTRAAQISITDRNTDIPFTPSASCVLLEGDKNTFFSFPFTWIQAFFDSTLNVNPVLAVYSGKTNADGSRQANYLQFAYSGERVKFKGLGILSSGKDCRGVTITSIPIGNTPSSDLLQVVVYGGAY